MTAYMVVAAWLLFLVILAAPFELTQRGRRITARILDRWF